MLVAMQIVNFGRQLILYIQLTQKHDFMRYFACKKVTIEERKQLETIRVTPIF